MTRPYKDRDEDQKAKVRANSKRYATSPFGRIRQRARRKAREQTAKIHNETFQRLYRQYVDEGYEQYEREQGLPT